jgi:uncharacterized membrane protein
VIKPIATDASGVNGSGRYQEVDLFRGIAVVMMIVFHTVFDLTYFGIAGFDVTGGFWNIIGTATASLFLGIVGISLTLSDERAKRTLDTRHRFLKVLRRGAGIFCLGLLVTLATWLYLKEGCIIFGILHLIGVSVIIGWFFLRLRWWNIPLGLAWIAAGVLFFPQAGPLSLLWLGIHPGNFASVDYTPLFPWFGVVLLGIGMGAVLYPGGTRRFGLPSFSSVPFRPLTFLGQRSLIIYLVHQPVLLVVIQVVTGRQLLF